MDDQSTNQPPQTTPAAPATNPLLSPPTSTEEGSMLMRNVMDGTVKPAVKAGGKDAHGRVRYTPQTGYEPVGMHTVDVDGTWLEIVTPKAGAQRGATVPAMSGANAIVSDEDQAKLDEDAKKAAAARSGTAPSDAVVDATGKAVLTPDGQPPHEGEEGKNDLGENIQTGRKRGR